MSSWDVSRLTAHLGDYDIRTQTETQHVSRKIKRLVRHKGFDSRTLVSGRSIGLIRCGSQVKANDIMRDMLTYSREPLCCAT